jgi:hypothetical protein
LLAHALQLACNFTDFPLLAGSIPVGLQWAGYLYLKIVATGWQQFSGRINPTQRKSLSMLLCGASASDVQTSMKSTLITSLSLAVSLRTTKFNIQKFYMVLALR